MQSLCLHKGYPNEGEVRKGRNGGGGANFFKFYGWTILDSLELHMESKKKLRNFETYTRYAEFADEEKKKGLRKQFFF